jgi:hypothetical protein
VVSDRWRLLDRSDIRVPLVQRGIPCVGIGSECGNLAQNSMADEFVDVDDFVRLVTVVAGIMEDWCGVVGKKDEQ